MSPKDGMPGLSLNQVGPTCRSAWPRGSASLPGSWPMSRSEWNQALPLELSATCKRLGIGLTRSVLVVRIARQIVELFQRPCAAPRSCFMPPCPAAVAGKRHHFVRRFNCSTSRFGIGQEQGSNRTPLGLHRIVEKIGGGWPAGAVFESRRMIGFTWSGIPNASIAHRILWLDGLQPGLNRGGSVDSHRRYMYIHGRGDERGLGRPASCGCIHLAARDLIPLFDRIPSGTLVWIAAD